MKDKTPSSRATKPSKCVSRKLPSWPVLRDLCRRAGFSSVDEHTSKHYLSFLFNRDRRRSRDFPSGPILEARVPIAVELPSSPPRYSFYKVSGVAIPIVRDGVGSLATLAARVREQRYLAEAGRASPVSAVSAGVPGSIAIGVPPRPQRRSQAAAVHELNAEARFRKGIG